MTDDVTGEWKRMISTIFIDPSPSERGGKRNGNGKWKKESNNSGSLFFPSSAFPLFPPIHHFCHSPIFRLSPIPWVLFIPVLTRRSLHWSTITTSFLSFLFYPRIQFWYALDLCTTTFIKIHRGDSSSELSGWFFFSNPNSNFWGIKSEITRLTLKRLVDRWMALLEANVGCFNLVDLELSNQLGSVFPVRFVYWFR